MIIRNKNLIIFLIMAFFTKAVAQCPSSTAIYNQVIAVEDYVNKSGPSINLLKAQLVKLNVLKGQFETCKLPQDSVYARMLHRISDYEYQLNHRIATVNSINYT